MFKIKIVCKKPVLLSEVFHSVLVAFTRRSKTYNQSKEAITTAKQNKLELELPRPPK